MPSLINPRIGWRNLGGAVVAYNCGNQNMAIWNESASEVWEMIAEGKPVDAIRSWLSQTYGISIRQATDDLASFLEEAVSMGFLSGSTPSLPCSMAELDADNESAAQLLLHMEMKAITECIPYAVTFEVTYGCNESCIHCYMDQSGSPLSTEEIYRILAELATEGCLFVSFTGGEFFTRPDWLDILTRAHELHFATDILTNGTLIDEAIAAALGSLAVRRVQVSLYGATAQTHDAVTQIAGAFEQTMQGIRQLRSNGVKVEIATMLMASNFIEVYAIKSLAESLGCQLSPSPLITARNSGDAAPHNLRLTDDQMKSFLADETLVQSYGGRKPFKDHQLYLGFTDIRDAAPCYSGFNCCAITPTGKVLPCNQLLLEVGDLRQRSFGEIWKNSQQLNYLRTLQVRDLPHCANCPTLEYCSRCPGLALLEGCDLLGPSPENCRISRILCHIDRGKEVNSYETNQGVFSPESAG